MTRITGSQRAAGRLYPLPVGFALPTCSACRRAMELRLVPRGTRVDVRVRCRTSWCVVRVRCRTSWRQP